MTRMEGIQVSKFSLDVLQRCVHPYVETSDLDIILGSVFGEDVALTRIRDGILVSHVDPIVGAIEIIGWLAVHVACNGIATCGSSPLEWRLTKMIYHNVLF